MHLYLSSFGIGDHPDALVELVGVGARIGVVLNAIDDRSASDRTLAGRLESDELRRLGLVPTELDLRVATDVDRLAEVAAVWVRGGNTFVLRDALAVAGADEVISARVRAQTMTYAGYSAGGAVLAPDLDWVAEVDDSRAVASPRFDGLGLIDRPVVPHVGGRYPEALECSALSARLDAAGRAHVALRDGDVLIDRGAGPMILPRH
ncbi:Type 1 glutamine amidotransferase-like domain-containing protein [Williamsia sp. CHRR-6]|uniref:Type 1 glutamine amidotransferase-like domain-containing protein n=1 Tax=Williamsia sp. CHRR-6 TaxID=2835871 RepID=UPI001BDAF742|nr:Type 1 glutamine amidotransferase-like domain-containing protein [Williamsia sp. CHRR-6]MBT0565607.1 Type 1 glutamine amidotransferase-like domain-containing protein [Williamsia sp. CHRR-6]